MARRGRGAVRTAAVAAATLLGVSACGGQPSSFDYVASKDNGLVVRIPRTWSELDAKQILGGSTTADQWYAFYDASPQPAVEHVNDKLPADLAAAPVVQLASFKLTQEQKDGLTDDDLRDLLLPVTEQGVRKQTIQAFMDAQPEPAVSVVRDEQVDTKTAKGVHVISVYDFGGGPVVRDKVVVTDPKRTHVHLIEVSCSIDCYTQHQQEIDSVIDSFTVKPQQ